MEIVQYSDRFYYFWVTSVSKSENCGIVHCSVLLIFYAGHEFMVAKTLMMFWIAIALHLVSTHHLFTLCLRCAFVYFSTFHSNSFQIAIEHAIEKKFREILQKKCTFLHHVLDTQKLTHKVYNVIWCAYIFLGYFVFSYWMQIMWNICHESVYLHKVFFPFFWV